MADRTVTRPLSALPSIDALLREPTVVALRERTGAARLTTLARAITDELRAELRTPATIETTANGAWTRASLLTEAVKRLERAVERERDGALCRVINATGVILHTNFARAPLSEAARRARAHGTRRARARARSDSL